MAGVVEVPSPFTGSVWVAYGVPVQAIASGVGNGPHSSTSTVADRLPSPVTATASVIDAPGAVRWALTCVRTDGVPMTTVVSATSLHVVSAARTKSVAAMPSRYV